MKSINLSEQESPHKALNDYLNKQDIKMAFEIEPPSCQFPKKDCTMSLLSDIESHNPELRLLKSSHKKEGIMRRNKLLLEHILHERYSKHHQSYSNQGWT